MENMEAAHRQAAADPMAEVVGDSSVGFQEIAEVASLALTLPTVVLGIAVVWIWGPPAVRAIRAGMGRGDDWLVLGVVMGFAGAIGDNLYWGLAWGAKLFGYDAADDLFRFGVFSNIPFRQGLGIAAAYCHIRAGEENLPKLRRVLNRLLLGSYAAAAGFLVVYFAFTRGA